MRMVVAGGGTGGHLFPGLAVADACMAGGTPSADVCFIGSAFGIEARVIPATRYAFVPLTIRGLRGRGLRGGLDLALQFPRAVFAAWRVLGRFRPSLVLGLGGYGSAPVVVAAWVRGVPSVLLEQNARPGLANRSLAHLARRVCTAFADSAGYFPAGKSVHTGNPVRCLAADAATPRGHFTVLVFGGSQGARSINRAMVEAVAVLRVSLPEMEIIHQTGEADAEAVREGYRAAGVVADVSAFIQNMGEAYGRADLVVCRSGATTLAELAALGKPAILVPYPHAADDHQRANAELVVARGAAEMILDQELSGELLAARIRDLAADRERLARMHDAALSLAMIDAAEAVLRVCREVVEENG